MDNRASVAALLADIDEITPGGFAIGLHISYNGPKFLFQTFPIDWITHYTENGLHLQDPAVAWSFAETGYVRWRDLAANDPAGVISKAAEFGLPYGATLSIEENGSRSVLGCGRTDREYLDAELDDITAKLVELHNLTLTVQKISKRDVEALTKMSIRMSHS